MELKMEYLYKDTVSTTIWADYKTREIRIKNHTDKILNRAFGVNESPTFKDYEKFLEDRCFPRTRDHAKELLRSMGLDYYNPLAIIKNTGGHLAGDFYWIRLIDGGTENEEKDEY